MSSVRLSRSSWVALTVCCLAVTPRTPPSEAADPGRASSAAAVSLIGDPGRVGGRDDSGDDVGAIGSFAPNPGRAGGLGNKIDALAELVRSTAVDGRTG